MSRKKINLSAEQKAALKRMLSGDNIFLTGKAGTGKSTVVERFREASDENVAYVAPTGIAAVNIRGATIHSFFQIKPGVFSDIEPLKSDKKRRVLRNLRTIVIDEISMVRSDLLEAIDKRMREVATGKDHAKPFGGVQLIVVGDFYQLPPVVQGKNEEAYLSMRYGGPFAFQSKVWAEAGFETIELQTIHRQSDSAFVDVLNKVRNGDDSDIDRINDNCLGRSSKTDSIILTPFRATADRYNADELAKLNTTQKVYCGEIFDKFTKDLPVDEHLVLRVGARVMAKANVYGKGEEIVFCNGDLGEVVSLSDNYVVVKFDNGTTASVQPYEWCAYDFDLSGQVVTAKETGKYRQIPLQLAWAVTIHKSQGCTFEHCTLDLGRGCFAPGQLYTALSRVKSMEGLSLTRRLTQADVSVSEEVVHFMS
jgi:ATP-dependent exoDNAse (exonuclease V) alpha subunit